VLTTSSTRRDLWSAGAAHRHNRILIARLIHQKSARRSAKTRLMIGVHPSERLCIHPPLRGADVGRPSEADHEPDLSLRRKSARARLESPFRLMRRISRGNANYPARSGIRQRTAWDTRKIFVSPKTSVCDSATGSSQHWRVRNSQDHHQKRTPSSDTSQFVNRVDRALAIQIEGQRLPDRGFSNEVREAFKFYSQNAASEARS